MTSKIWLNEWDLTHMKFHWLFVEYGQTKAWFRLLAIRENGQHAFTEEQMVDSMKDIMNDVWFKLPNFKMIPKGWDDFLYLIETQ